MEDAVIRVGPLFPRPRALIAGMMSWTGWQQPAEAADPTAEKKKYTRISASQKLECPCRGWRAIALVHPVLRFTAREHAERDPIR